MDKGMANEAARITRKTMKNSRISIIFNYNVYAKDREKTTYMYIL